MTQFDNNEIKRKIIEAKKKLKILSLDYKKNFINIEKTIGLEVEEIVNDFENPKNPTNRRGFLNRFHRWSDYP